MRTLGVRPRPRRAVLGRRGRRDRRVHVPGAGKTGEPARQCARCNGNRTRRQGRVDPSATARDRRCAHRHQSHWRRRRAAVVLVRPRGARIPAAQLRNEGRVRRSAVAAEHGGDSRALSGRRAGRRRRGRARFVDHAVGGDARNSLAAFFSRRKRRDGSGVPRVHERDDRSAERRVDAAAMPDRQPARIRLFA